jgi:hypothetical protein
VVRLTEVTNKGKLKSYLQLIYNWSLRAFGFSHCSP